MSSLPAALRREQILERIRRDGGVTVAELARDLAVSSMTAHRDLEQLAREGLVVRVRGGARALEAREPQQPHPTAWAHRVAQAAGAKAAIAAEAAALVGPGSTVFLDASSTALALAHRLMEEPPYELTIVTNSPMLAAEIQAEAIHVVVCPGELDQQTRSVAGRWTVEFIRRLNFDTAFLSAAGLTLEAGLTTSRSPLADVFNAARESAAETIALIDAGKIGRTSLVSIVAPAELDLLICDDGVDAAAEAALRAAGVALHVAGRGEAPRRSALQRHVE